MALQTVYGGTLDVTRGKLTVTHGTITFNGSEDWLDNSPNGVFLVKPSVIKNLTLSNMYEVLEPGAGSGLSNGQMRLSQNKTNILVKDEDALTPALFKAKLALTPLTVTYELATPVTVQLSPTTVRAIVGANNVYSDTGDITVKYKDSIQHYIDKKVSI